MTTPDHRYCWRMLLHFCMCRSPHLRHRKVCSEDLGLPIPFVKPPRVCLQVAFNQRGRNASQANIGGTGIGAFNDRFRDAVMGGSPFASPQHQGWATGMGTQPSAFTQVGP